MDNSCRVKLVLFSNTFPFGEGETFLADEIQYLAKYFHRITVFPLYQPEGGQRNVPANVDIATPLLPFDHKSKKGFLRHGLFNTAPFFFATKEFFRALSGSGIKLESSPGKKSSPEHKKGSLGKRLRIFFSHFLMLRTILSNKKLMEEIVRECAFADKIYFYWGDKSVMIAPFLKKLLKPNVENLPVVIARFHGSDLYEGVKGYLPFRNRIFSEVDYAAAVSYNGKEYIKNNYNPCPKIIEIWHLGSTHHDENFRNNENLENSSDNNVADKNVFNIIGCSNLIPLKRVSLIIRALKLLTKDSSASLKIKKRGFDKITYTHFGGGPLLQSLKKESAAPLDNDSFEAEIQLSIDFKGRVLHKDILDYYRENGADLFILASSSEGIPVSIMEAMSYGIPVIATNVGGVSELFAENVECLIDANISAEELKEKILEYILLPDSTHNQMKRNCYLNWEKSWDAETNYTAFAQELLSL